MSHPFFQNDSEPYFLMIVNDMTTIPYRKEPFCASNDETKEFLTMLTN